MLVWWKPFIRAGSLRVLSLFTLLLAISAWPGSMLAPNNMSACFFDNYGYLESLTPDPFMVLRDGPKDGPWQMSMEDLPAWQRELLSDPGWNKPYMAPKQAAP